MMTYVIQRIFKSVTQKISLVASEALEDHLFRKHDGHKIKTHASKHSFLKETAHKHLHSHSFVSAQITHLAT